MLVAEHLCLKVSKPSVRVGQLKLPVSVVGFLFMIRKPQNTVVRFLKKFNFLIFFFIFLLVGLVGAFFWWRWAVGPVDLTSAEVQIFVIKQGEGGKSAAQRLQEAGLINNAWAFRVLAYLLGLESQIQAGDFQLQPAWSARQIAEAFTHGTMDIWVTFPEGWRREQYARRLVANLENFAEEEFLTLTSHKEGYLFPDTYLFPKGASAEQAVAILEGNFAKKVPADWEKMAATQDLVLAQVLTLASLVEREVDQSQSKSIVAGILLKRWRAGWPLQVDATLQYAKASQACQSCGGDQFDWWPLVTAADKQLPSPYNTYQNSGLPPGPICNPGLDSLKAVVQSQETDYWFYLTDSRGQMHYAVTAEEHAANIARFLR